MRPGRRPLLLVAMILLAGCLEAPAPTQVSPAAGLHEDLLDDVEDALDEPVPVSPSVPTLPTAPTTTPPEPDEPPVNRSERALPEGDILYRNVRAASESSVGILVPEGVARLVLVVESNATFDGDVLLLDADGRVAASCAGRSCEAEAAGIIAAGEWSIAFLEVPGDVAVTLVAQAEVAPAPGTGPALEYLRTVSYAGRVNETDHLGIYATSGRVTGRVVLEVGDGDAASVVIRDGAWKTVLRCEGAGVVECPLGFTGASPRAWVVEYAGSGNGTARVELKHEVDSPASPPPDASNMIYGGSHNYRTWGDRRGDFSNGFVVPSGWGGLLVNVTFDRTAEADDPGTTARVLLVSPEGEVAGTCAPAAERCQFSRPATPGLWRVRFEGVDASFDCRVTALLSAR